MIGENNTTHYLNTKFFSDLRNYLMYSTLQCTPENFVTVLGDPNYMISIKKFGIRFAIMQPKLKII